MEQDYFDESHYFMCTGGFKPARFKTNQKQIAKREDGNFYLTINSRKCHTFGDFSCRYVALLIAIIAALIAVLCSCPAGWVLLAAIAGAAVGAGIGMKICGDRAAIAREWQSIYVLTIIEGQETVTNQITEAHMKCKAFDYPINYMPNIKTELDAWFVFVVNVGFTGLEAFVTVYAARGATLLFTQPKVFACNFVVNYIKSISLSGILMRWGFSEVVGQQTYYTSQVEGGNAEEIANAKSEAFWFVEKPLSRIATLQHFSNDEEGNLKFNSEQFGRDITVPLMLGGMSAGPTQKNSNNGLRGKMGKATDATPVDAVRAWDATFKPFIENAKAFREGLKKEKKATGAFEKFDPRNDPRWEELSKEEGKTSKGDLEKAANEAEAILIAEKHGIVRNPRRPVRSEPDLDFVVEGPEPYKYCDVKTPVNRGNLDSQATHIGGKIKMQKGGSNDTLHVVDLKNIPKENQAAFKENVIKGAGSEEGIVFVND